MSRDIPVIPHPTCYEASVPIVRDLIENFPPWSDRIIYNTWCFFLKYFNITYFKTAFVLYFFKLQV